MDPLAHTGILCCAICSETVAAHSSQSPAFLLSPNGEAEVAEERTEASEIKCRNGHAVSEKRNIRLIWKVNRLFLQQHGGKGVTLHEIVHGRKLELCRNFVLGRCAYGAKCFKFHASEDNALSLGLQPRQWRSGKEQAVSLTVAAQSEGQRPQRIDVSRFLLEDYRNDSWLRTAGVFKNKIIEHFKAGGSRIHLTLLLGGLLETKHSPSRSVWTQLVMALCDSAYILSQIMDLFQEGGANGTVAAKFLIQAAQLADSIALSLRVHSLSPNAVTPELNQALRELRSVCDAAQPRAQPPKAQVLNPTTHDSSYALEIDGLDVLPTTNKELLEAPAIIPRNYDQWSCLRTHQDAMFRLLREEYIAPLRDCVSQILGGTIKTKFPVFHGVKIGDPSEGDAAFTFWAKFSTFKHIDWSSSSRPLSYGTLLILLAVEKGVTTRLKHFVPATASFSVTEHLEKSQMKLCFLPDFFSKVDFGVSYLMFESPVLFQAIGPVLEIFKHGRFLNPLYPLAVFGERGEKEPPQYLRAANISEVIKTHGKLNESQRDAVLHTLTSRIALVHGPPGTGKSYVGVSLVKTLLQFAHAGHHSPLLVIAYTNHALDKFLHDIAEEIGGDRVLRVGNRSKILLPEDTKVVSDLVPENTITEQHEIRFKRRDIYSMSLDRRKLSLTLKDITSVRFIRTALSSELEAVFETIPSLWQAYTSLTRSSELCGIGVRAWMDGNENQVGLEMSQAAKAAILRHPQYYGEFDDEDRYDSDSNFSHAANLDYDTSEGSSSYEGDSDSGSSEDLSVKRDEDGSDCSESEWVYVGPRKTRESPSAFLIAHATDFLEKNLSPENVWTMSSASRKRLLVEMRRSLSGIARQEIADINTKMARLEKEVKELQLAGKKQAIWRWKVLGMTSSYAAANCDLVKVLMPKIAICEEAGELLEPQLLGAIESPRLEHLILLGDHNQLRPHLHNHSLVQKKFDISVFERLVTGQKFESVMLKVQHRMSPQIRALTSHFYGGLVEDAPRCLEYPAVAGLQSQVFFLTHSQPEDSDIAMSKSHELEASFAVNLAAYFQRRGDLNPTQITLLTGYRGQKERLESIANECKDLKGLVISTVDNYQGEENDIVILSLVRSNARNSIGFGKVENRIIVALTRARYGLYIVGNSTLFRCAEPWSGIIEKLEEDNCLGTKLDLTCERHGSVTGVDLTSDFSAVRNGGCDEPCTDMLLCGHICRKLCHPGDHANAKCFQPCLRNRPTGCSHPCRELCHQCGEVSPIGPCGTSFCGTECQDKVKTTLDCSHVNVVSCHDHTSGRDISCDTVLRTLASCGHIVAYTCGELSGLCSVSVEIALDCGHSASKPCHQKDEVVCISECERSEYPLCEHACTLKCSLPHDHEKCQERCNEELVCRHKCAKLCSEPHTDVCMEKCETKCPHSSSCPKPCGDPCVECREPCQRKCEHQSCKKLCGEICDRPPCSERCRKGLSCGHRCQGLCGEMCPPCVFCKSHIAKEVDIDSADPLGHFFEKFRADEDRFRNMKTWPKKGRTRRRGKKNKRTPVIFETEKDAFPAGLRLFAMTDCRCIFLMSSLDRYMSESFGESASKNMVGLVKCPKCRACVYRAMRYRTKVLKQFKAYNNLKTFALQPFSNTGSHCSVAGYLAMQLLGVSIGKWYQCEKGHLYIMSLDSDSNEKVGVCPDCSGFIGASGPNFLEPGNVEASRVDRSDRKMYGIPLPTKFMTDEVKQLRITAKETNAELVAHFDFVCHAYEEVFQDVRRVKAVFLLLNRKLIERFACVKAELFKMGRAAERLMFHGTAESNLDSILHDGLVVGGSQGVPISRGAAYGKGIYLGQTPNVSRGYAKGSRKLLFCRVLVCCDRMHGKKDFAVIPIKEHVLPAYIVET